MLFQQNNIVYYLFYQSASKIEFKAIFEPVERKLSEHTGTKAFSLRSDVKQEKWTFWQNIQSQNIETICSLVRTAPFAITPDGASSEGGGPEITEQYKIMYKSNISDQETMLISKVRPSQSDCLANLNFNS